MPREEWQLDRVPGLRERVRETAHRLGRTGEAVQHQRAVRSAGRGERLGAGHRCNELVTVGHAPHDARRRDSTAALPALPPRGGSRLMDTVAVNGSEV